MKWVARGCGVYFEDGEFAFYADDDPEMAQAAVEYHNADIAALEAERDELKRHIAHSEYGRHRWREKALVARAECDKYKRRLAKIQGIAEGRKP